MDQQENNSISHQRTLSAIEAQDLAETLCHHLALDQQVVLRLFGRNISGELNDEQFVALLRNFSLELPRRKHVAVEALASGVAAGESFTNALAALNTPMRRKDINLRMMEKALANAQDKNALPAFLNAVSAYRPSRRPLALRYHDTMRKKMIRLVIKTLFILQLVVFLMLFIVPELMQIFQEFGVELPYLFRLVLTIADVTVRYWFLFALLLMLVFRSYLYPRTWLQLLRQVIAKFSPWSWLHRPLSQKQQQELSVVLTGTPTNAQVASLPSLNRNEKRALETAHSDNAKSWLLSRRVRENDRRTAVWKNRLSEFLISVWNVVLACVVAAFAISIVSCLTAIIEGVCGD